MGLAPAQKLYLRPSCASLWVILCLFISLSAPAWGLPLKANQGEIDLQLWQSSEPLSLHGDWHFFWNEKLMPAEVLRRLHSPDYRPTFAKVGTRFRDIVPDATKDDQGFATYVLVLRNLPNTRLALTALSAYTASDLYLFSEVEGSQTTPLARHGRFDTQAAFAKPFIVMSGMVSFQATPSPVHYIVIHVSNYHYVWGGLWIPPQIASEQAIFDELRSTERSNYLIVGMLIIVFFYNFSFYLRRREDKASLFLACFVAIAILRGFQLARWNHPFMADQNFAFEVSLKIIFLSMGGLILAFLHFLKACFPKQSSRWFIRAYWVVLAPQMLIVILSPAAKFGYLSEAMKFMSALSALLVLTVIVRAVRAKEEGALASLIGALFLSAGGLMDIAYTLGVKGIPTNSTGMGLVIFVACQSQIIAVRFAIAFRNSEHLSRSLADEVERQTREIKSILKSIRQGIFTIVHPLKRVGDQYSDHLISILGQSEIAGQSLDHLLLSRSDLSSDSKSQIQAALDASLGEHGLAFEINEANFVHEIKFQKGPEHQAQILEIDWNPIFNKQDEVEKILVSLRDVTEMRFLKEDAEKREEDMKIIIELIKIPEERFQRFFSKANEYITENRELILNRNVDHGEVIKRLFMNMHTIKGASRTYFLHSISTAAHEAEQYYAALMRHEAEWDEARLIHELDAVNRVMSHYQEVGQDRLGWSQRNHIIKIDRSKLTENLFFLESLDPRGLNHLQKEQIGLVIARLGALCYDSLLTIVDEASRGLDSIARDLRKEPPKIVVNEAKVLLKEQGSEVLYNILIHLFRNSMDHGIECPELRVQRSKPVQGNIELTFSIEADSLILNFKDDGNGLDLNAIKTKALDRHLIQSDRIYTDAEIASLIFISGFSTKSSVNEISGRGVGLDAVKSYSERVGVQVAIQLGSVDNLNRVPFSFDLTIPPQLFWRHVTSESNMQQAS